MFSAAIKTDNVSSAANYIEECFSTYLYTGTGAAQTITNGIDLSTKGGLVWVKSRSAGYLSHVLADTVRGNTKVIYSNLTAPQDTFSTGISSFNSNGFSIGSSDYYNESAGRFVSWTFREQAKFFDIVTYTGNGANNRQISHNLGSAPGCIILKRTDGTGEWWTYHRSLGDVGGFSYDLQLNTTSNKTAYQIFGTGATQTSTYFTLGTVFAAEMNGNGANYVAYLFAHDAGGFGLTGTDNVISCGSYTGTGAIGNAITLGYEPQWVMVKASSGTSAASQDWYIYDNMRGIFTGTSTNDPRLMANLSDAEASYPEIAVSATGFVCEATGARLNESGTTYIYIAIRRGPMKTPTSGTSVFLPTAFSGNGGSGSYVNGFPTDLIIHSTRNTAGLDHFDYDRLRGKSPQLQTNTTGAEFGAQFYNFDQQNSVTYSGNNSGFNASGETYIDWNFRRAPGFFDEVCYAGDGTTNRAVAHNLTVAPELIIVKARSAANYWWMVYAEPLGPGKYLALQATFASGTNSAFPLAQTATNFYVSATGSDVNVSSVTFVAYLFATLAGVSKVGSYTGTGALQTINCGFASGARFVLIKRTDSTGDWYVWDSARGISSGNDPYLLINSTAAEVTSTNYVDTTAVGFQVTAAAPAALNASGGTYIFLAVA
jgi:hypothetical protein